MPNAEEQIEFAYQGCWAMKVKKAFMVFAVFAIVPMIQWIIEKINRFSVALDRVAFKIGQKL